MNKSHMEMWLTKYCLLVEIHIIWDATIHGCEWDQGLESLTINYERCWFEWEHNYVLILFNHYCKLIMNYVCVVCIIVVELWLTVPPMLLKFIDCYLSSCIFYDWEDCPLRVLRWILSYFMLAMLSRHMSFNPKVKIALPSACFWETRTSKCLG